MNKRVNLINALGIAFKEDIISNLIASLLTDSKSFREAFRSVLVTSIYFHCQAANNDRS